MSENAPIVIFLCGNMDNMAIIEFQGKNWFNLMYFLTQSFGYSNTEIHENKWKARNYYKTINSFTLTVI